MRTPSPSGLIGMLSRRASIGGRFWLIALAALAPLALLSGMVWRDLNQDLARVAQAQSGVEYARTVWRVMHGAARMDAVDEVRVQNFDAVRTAYDTKLGVAHESASLRRLIAEEAPPTRSVQPGFA